MYYLKINTKKLIYNMYLKICSSKRPVLVASCHGMYLKKQPIKKYQ